MIAPTKYLAVPGTIVTVDKLRISRIKDLAKLLKSGKMDFVRLIECYTSSPTEGHETIVFDVDVQRPQVLANDIRLIERLAVTFSQDDNYYPEVVALRPDFPQVPHLNLRPQELPRSLCLYEEPWHDIKLTWTAPAFIERVRRWLSLTAQGILHSEDQPLEPIIFGSGYHIVVPKEIFYNEAILPERLDIILVGGQAGRVFVAFKPGKSLLYEKSDLLHVATVLKCKPQQHGIIRRTPHTLKELNELTSEAGLNIIEVLRKRFKDWMEFDELLKARLVLILQLPKTRHDEGPVEVTEMKCFLTTNTVQEVGINIGLWDVHEGKCSYLIPIDTLKDGSDIDIIVLNPHQAFNWELGAALNGLSQRNVLRITAIGAGALGSQLITNLTRAGYGNWTIIDEDFLLPHNLARHALHANAVGIPKGVALAHTVNLLDNDEEIATAIKADVLAPGNQESVVDEALNNTDVILDMAISIPVSRHLAHHPSHCRRVSLFMNPTATALIILTEDSKRKIPLDCLEMQYYRALCHDNRLLDHLTQAEQLIRYGLSCRDLSARTPQDLIAIQAGIGARALRLALKEDKSTISVWKTDPEGLNVEAINIPVFPVKMQDHLDWTLVIDHWVLQTISRFRQERLPVETGGVLIGTHDMQRKIVYITDALPSPPDSEEWPTLYIRGCEELATKVEEIKKITAQNLDYVGEWHSHPDGCQTYPSADDGLVFSWLTEEMDIEGKPPLMFIAGENDSVRTFLCRMAERVMEELCPY